MTIKLEDIRGQIDSLDNRIHDLLMERAALIGEIAAEKRRHGIHVVQPAREALMIRRLLARHKGVLPKAAVVRIWRELVGAVSLLQTGLRVAVTLRDNGAGHSSNWDMARDYFGSVLPMVRTHNALAAVSMVREGEANFAVLPWPEEDDSNPWWMYLMGDSPESLRIVVRLPYADRPGVPPNPEHMALVISRGPFEPTEDDRSFLAIEVGPGVSRARILDVARALGMTPLSLHSRKAATQSAPTRHLLEIAGYAGGDDPRLADFVARLEDAAGRCVCVGGYPSPPVYDLPEDGRAPFVSAPSPQSESSPEAPSEGASSDEAA